MIFIGGFITDFNGNRLQILPVDAAGNVTALTPQDAVIPLTNGASATKNMAGQDLLQIAQEKQVCGGVMDVFVEAVRLRA